jgi:hypothetical protein
MNQTNDINEYTVVDLDQSIEDITYTVVDLDQPIDINKYTVVDLDQPIEDITYTVVDLDQLIEQYYGNTLVDLKLIVNYTNYDNNDFNSYDNNIYMTQNPIKILVNQHIYFILFYILVLYLIILF